MLYNIANSSTGRCNPCSCAGQSQYPGVPICPPGPQGPQGIPGPPGPQGPTGPAGPTAATIPFSISQSGAELGTDAEGNPQIIHFLGFGPAQNGFPLFLQGGEWASGTIPFGEDKEFGSAFVMPYDAILKNIYVLFSSKYGPFLDAGITLYPFVCLAVSNSSTLVYTILQDTITYTEPYIGGVEYPKHTLRRGSLTNLNIPISEGTLVAIVAGVRAEGAVSEQYGQFAISGGLFLE